MMTEQTDRPRIYEAPQCEAMQEADRLRREHNGIGGVYLYLGHDGDNACEFRDIDGKTLAKANSGRSILEAIQRCEVEWRKAQWAGKLKRLMWDAAVRFSPKQEKAEQFGIFNTANLQNVIRERFDVMPTGSEIVAALTCRLDVVRLSGGCHWYLLPEGLERHD